MAVIPVGHRSDEEFKIGCSLSGRSILGERVRIIFSRRKQDRIIRAYERSSLASLFKFDEFQLDSLIEEETNVCRKRALSE